MLNLQLFKQACYDIRQAPTLWKKMRLAEESDPDDEIEWLSTHPSHETREASLRSLIPQALKLRSLCDVMTDKDQLITIQTLNINLLLMNPCFSARSCNLLMRNNGSSSTPKS